MSGTRTRNRAGTHEPAGMAPRGVINGSRARVLREAAFIIPLLLAVQIQLGCDDGMDESASLPIHDLAGNWEAIEFTVQQIENPDLQVDLILAGGGMRLGIQPNGAFSGIVTFPGSLLGQPEIPLLAIPLSGVIDVVDAESLRLDFVPELPPLFITGYTGFALAGDTLELIDESSKFDFDQDSVEEPATLHGTFVRTDGS